MNAKGTTTLRADEQSADAKRGVAQLVSAARWEIGGEFHWMGLPESPFVPWPKKAVWYSTGRQAVLSLAAQLSGNGRRRLWIPGYFCDDVADSWASAFDVRSYDDDPTREEPRWESLRPGHADVVMAVNYCGARQFGPWGAWLDKHQCIFVEDHTHDPMSPWALNSRADYAFTSIRKTLPVPDGAVLWSPAGHALAEVPSGSRHGVSLKTAAMLVKAEYLAGVGGSDLKRHFRQLQLEGEAALEGEPIVGASALTRAYVANGYPATTRVIRRTNAEILATSSAEFTAAKPLCVRWPVDASPFGFVLRFQNTQERDDARERLRANDIYCPIHWKPGRSWPEALQRLSAELLTIPIDQRYGREDMQRVVRVLTGDFENIARVAG